MQSNATSSQRLLQFKFKFSSKYRGSLRHKQFIHIRRLWTDHTVNDQKTKSPHEGVLLQLASMLSVLCRQHQCHYQAVVFHISFTLRHQIVIKKSPSIPVCDTLDTLTGCTVFVLSERPVVICEISQTWWVRDRKWKSVAECVSPTRSVLYHWLPYGCLSSLNIYIATACQRNHERERGQPVGGGHAH